MLNQRPTDVNSGNSRQAVATSATMFLPPSSSVSVEMLEDPLTALYAVAGLAAYAECDQPSGIATSSPPPMPTRVTPFHSASVPPISLVGYAKRVVRYAKCGNTGLALGLVLLGRYCKSTGERVDRLTAHRLLLASIVVGVKAHYDIFYSNAYYGQVGGISTKEMNKLELALLQGLHFSATATGSEVAAMLPSLSSAGQQVPLDHDGWPAKSNPSAVASAAQAVAVALFDIPRTCAPLMGPPRTPTILLRPRSMQTSARVSPSAAAYQADTLATSNHHVAATSALNTPTTSRSAFADCDPQHYAAMMGGDGVASYQPSPFDPAAPHRASPWGPVRDAVARHAAVASTLGASHLQYGHTATFSSATGQHNGLYAPTSAAVSRRTSTASTTATGALL